MSGTLAATLLLLALIISPSLKPLATVTGSDGLAAGAFALAVLALVHRASPRAWVLAGFLAGYAVLVRTTGVFVLLALLVVGVRQWRRIAVGAVPPLAGSPSTNG